MGVDFVYRDRDGNRQLLTIATAEAYKKVWEKAARQMRLEIVATLRHGVVLDRERASSLLKELEHLKGWSGWKRPGRERVTPEKIEWLQAELTRLLAEGETEFSFG